MADVIYRPRAWIWLLVNLVFKFKLLNTLCQAKAVTTFLSSAVILCWHGHNYKQFKHSRVWATVVCGVQELFAPRSLHVPMIHDFSLFLLRHVFAAFQSNYHELIQGRWCNTLVQFVAKPVRCGESTLLININICSIKINECQKIKYQMIKR